MNIERDAHAVLKRLTEGLRNNHPTYLLRTYVSSAGIGLNEQKTMPKANWAFSPGRTVVKALSLSICTAIYFTGMNLSPCQSATRPLLSAVSTRVKRRDLPGIR